MPRYSGRRGRVFIQIGIAYAVLLFAALAWSMARGDGPLPTPAGVSFMRHLAGAAMGLAAGLVVVTGDWLSVRLFTWARRLEEEFTKILGPLSAGQVIFLAVTSSVAEEAFFRGAMQPTLGLTLTALVFGLAHLGPTRIYLPWTLMAIGMGFLLGWLYTWTSTLLAPIACHLAINTINLARIALSARGSPAPDS
ncbi:MAG TPA: CPBP family intramembrane glutamic endopeptidase [Myxococcota bacterium]|nr:CPBP family intramembrane glutamic endopeptidase [Myxococcota bacterium]